MRARLVEWLDDRTGVRGLIRGALLERIPGGARWRYVWGSTLTLVLGVQFVTGLLLWTAYSANAQGAWESVYTIQHQMAGGWLVRGIHHYVAQITPILLVLHLLQVVIDGAYKAPREVNFWFGLVLLLLVMGLSLTGYLLPWDQKGFWATKVATSIAAMSPVIGPALQTVLVGGSEYGHATLTRFFALHAGVLPLLVVLSVVAHVYLFRRHGITAKDPDARPEGMFWPDQILKDSVVFLAVMAVVLFLVLREGGAPLGAPADPADAFGAARPDASFLFLFQWLKYFPAGWEVVGAHIIPALVLGVIAAMPFLGRWRLGHRFNVAFLSAVLAGVALLTAEAIRSDRADPAFVAAQEDAEMRAARAVVLASAPDGIPPSGAVTLVRNDPLIQGPEIFAQSCASCHRFNGHDGLGVVPEDEPSASDLSGFASREWLTGLLDPDQVDGLHYFGGTAFSRGRMVRFVQRRLQSYDDSVRAMVPSVVAALSAEAALPAQAQADSVDAAVIAEGRRWLVSEAMGCVDCHVFEAFGEDPTGPLLTGFGSQEWTEALIGNPAHPDFYGARNDRMPAFAADGVLTEAQIRMVAAWIRGAWYEPEEGGVEPSGPE